MLTPSLSIIIPVYHEKEIINPLIASIKQQYCNEVYEIIVVDGSPQRDTIQTISFSDVIKIDAEYGRGQQLNAGAAVAQGNKLLFLHADTTLPENGLNTVIKHLNDKKVFAGAFDIRIDSLKWRFRILARLISLRARIMRLPFGDQAHFFTSGYFDKIGGYPDIAIMEDLEIMRRIKKRGDSITILKKSVYTSPRRWALEGIIRGTLRNWFIRTRYYLGEKPERLEKYYN
jgi:rSAM/selenodomain-associated transferase 2